MSTPVSLPHGYTNRTTRHGPVAIKTHRGPESAVRRETEARALTVLYGRLPVPALVGRDGARLIMRFMPGQHGQDLIAAGMAEPVLAACGRMLRRIHTMDPDLLSSSGPSRPGTVLVHGDYGPNNTLLDPAALEVTAIVDWEWAHAGDRIEDLAWCEWIVRMHHPDQVGALRSFFDTYQDRPAWTARREAMLARCQAMLDMAERWQPGGATVHQWQRRLTVTGSWTE
jgi:aminoglycoside phosphotransferase